MRPSVKNMHRRLRTAMAVNVAVVAMPAPSSAAPLDPPATDPFYQQVPGDLGSLPHGRLLRSRDVAAQITPGVPFDAHATQIVYTSRNLRGRADIVSGMVFVPNAPWTGAGPGRWCPGDQARKASTTPRLRRTSSRPAPTTRRRRSRRPWPMARRSW